MKPGVFTQLYVQIVFAVDNRQCLLRNKEHNEQIFKYISGTITNLKNKSIIVNGIEDHIHIFVGLHHTLSVSDLVGTIKKVHHHLLMKISGFMENSPGRMGMEHLHIVVLKLKMCSDILKIRRSTTKNPHLRTNISCCWINLGLNIMKNICLHFSKQVYVCYE